jgi:hypothetical protein
MSVTNPGRQPVAMRHICLLCGDPMFEADTTKSSHRGRQVHNGCFERKAGGVHRAATTKGRTRRLKLAADGRPLKPFAHSLLSGDEGLDWLARKAQR